jgi:hypothetical protein
MNLKLVRKEFTSVSTIGELSIDGKFFCFVLEDKDRGLTQSETLTSIKIKKIFGVTAIPYGKYKVVLSESPHFKRLLPEILNVKGYTGVRIHRGNTDKDTLGCLIVGFRKVYNQVFESAKAEEALIKELKGAIEDGEDINLEIVADKPLA